MSHSDDQDREFIKNAKGPVSWMAKNSVAANLLMLVAIVGGLLSAFSLKQEVFPEFELDVVAVTVTYPGASPSEIEQGIVLAVEEAVRGLDGVKRTQSVAAEGVGNVSIELLLGANPDKVLADVKNAVDRIQTFPLDAEEPTVSLLSRRRAVISLIFSGELEDAMLHDIAERARAELLALPEITQVELAGVRPLEISIEVPRQRLEAYGLTLEQIAQQVRAASVELPGGGIDTKGGEVLVRVADRRKRGSNFGDIMLRSPASTEEIRLSDIATIVDGYEDTDQESYFDGHPAVRVTAYRVGDETPMDVSDAVRKYAKRIEEELPETVSVAVWNDDSELLRSRIDLLVRNAKSGLLLVLITLALFLRRRLAFWVALGIPISFLGAFVVMGSLSASINMVTLFALIVTLGMVVDDAIIVSENIHSKRMQGMGPLKAAIVGAREMSVPVVFSILTTCAAFAPLLFIPGVMGKIMSLIPIVVMAVLFVSLVESFFVLPAHLAHEGQADSFWSKTFAPVFSIIFRPIDLVQRAVSNALEKFIERVYRPTLALLLRWRYAGMAFGIASLMVCFSLVKNGVVPFSFFPVLEGDVVTASVRLPYGTPVERTAEVTRILQKAANETVEQFGGESIKRGAFTLVGEGPRGRGPSAGAASQGSHLAVVELGLVPSEQRDFSSQLFADEWRAKLPPIPGVEALTISSAAGPGAGKAVDVQLSHRDSRVLAAASEELFERLREYPTLTNIDNTYSAGKPQLDFSLRREALGLGLTSSDIARSLRSAFFGAEALREQRGRNEVKVRVRLPEEQRSSEYDLEQLTVGTPSGNFVPLTYAADFKRGQAPTAITREDGSRNVNVSGELKTGVQSPRPVLESLERDVFPELGAKYPGLSMRLVGQQRERAESFASLGPNFLFALFVIFALLAVPFKSYIQPVVVMTAIPFGVLGAVLGHMLMGYELSFISVLGIIALSGVVVNDSLVLVDAINQYRKRGQGAWEAVIDAGARRFRPILLTSLTTFFGLLPMIFETSRQARFLIPMAISLGFGALFVTAIALLLVPSLYIIVEDFRKLFTVEPPGSEGVQAAAE
jgi:multidrug efflux pump subunit AcrB